MRFPPFFTLFALNEVAPHMVPDLAWGSLGSGGRRAVPRGRPVRPPDRATEGDLLDGLGYSRILYTNCIHQQISPCFLQDLQSEWKKEQMQKSYEGVKSETCCEVVTVGRRCAAEGAWIQGQTSPRMVADGSCRFVRLLRVTKGSVELAN